MMNEISDIDGVQVNPLKIIPVQGGNVYHALKSTDENYKGFGEAYFSAVDPGVIKPWRRHKVMTMNLIVPVGKIAFVIYDDREGSLTKGCFMKVVLSEDNYCCLMIPEKLWVRFQCIGNTSSMLLNISNILHDPEESESLGLDDIPFEWEQFQ